MRSEQCSAGPVLIAVGSNIDPERNIIRALVMLTAQARVEAVSTFYRTAPIDRAGQPGFLNGACRIRWEQDPRSLKFDVLRGIETHLGRVRTDDRYAPRTIDLDIAVFGNEMAREPDLSIPDPDLYTRIFLAASLAELAPNAVLPDSGETVQAVADRCCVDDLNVDAAFTEQLKARLGL